jgi:hypothetical protein
MPLIASDLKFFAGDATGNRSGTLVQDGVTGNVFEQVTTSDRLSGATLQKTVFLSATNSDTAPLTGASVAVNEVPSDPAVSVVIGSGALGTTTVALGSIYLAGTAASGSATLTSATAVPSSSTWYTPYIPDSVWVVSEVSATPRRCLRRVLAFGSGSVTLDSPVPYTGPVTVSPITASVAASQRTYGYTTLHTATSSGSDLVLAMPYARVLPLSDTSVYAGSVDERHRLAGHARVFVTGDAVTLYHEAATSPGTLTNGQVVNVGRTDIDQFAVVDSTGAEVARVLLNGPTVASVTPNFAAGTLTINSVTGWSMPCTVRHRIVHRTTVGHTDEQARITLGTVVTRTFPAGSVLTSHAPLTNLQAAVTLMFAQQAWTRAWSDSLIGNSASLPYTGAIVVNNQGAEQDRYAIVFRTATTFACYSERRGQLPDGSTASTYAPANTTLGGVLFTLGASGWASSIPVGTVLRFNTSHAAASFNARRVVAPSVDNGTTRVQFRAYGSAG